MVPLFIEYIQAIPLLTVNGITTLQNQFFRNSFVLYLFGYSNSVAPESIKNIGTAQYPNTATIKLCFQAEEPSNRCTIQLQCIATTQKLAPLFKKS